MAVEKVANMDVAGLADRITRFADEILKSQSATQNQLVPHDKKRSLEYLDRIEEYIKVINSPSQPLDLPKTHPTGNPVKPFPNDEVINAVENEIVKDVTRRFRSGHIEVTGSQSADMASGLHPNDTERLIALVTNTRGLLDLADITLDLPENTGNVAPSGS